MKISEAIQPDQVSAVYSYYPGCSLHSTGLEYGQSARSIFSHLGLQLNELPGWNCCGATSAHALDHYLALALPARNLALAQEANHDVAVPCAACFNRLKQVIYIMENDAIQREELQRVADFQYTGQVAVRHLLSILYEDVGCKQISSRVVHPLKGLKVAPYYGCLLLRPAQVVRFDDPDHPHIMGDLLRAAGAEVVSFSEATECCGGSLSLSRSDIVYRLVGRIVERAREAGAQALVTACPLCQVNLEMRQGGHGAERTTADKMPAFYFTELLGLAMGLPEAGRWWRKHLIDPRPLLAGAGL